MTVGLSAARKKQAFAEAINRRKCDHPSVEITVDVTEFEDRDLLNLSIVEGPNPFTYRY